MTWFKCVDKNCYFKVQYINAFLASQLVADMEARPNTDFRLSGNLSELSEEIHFELGGYGNYAYAQPRHTFLLGDSKLRVDDQQALDWLLKLKSAKQRTFADGTKYIKLHSRFCCLVLTQEERESLLFQMKGKLQEMQTASDAFLEQTWTKMRKNYEEEHGQEFPIVRATDLLPKDSN